MKGNQKGYEIKTRTRYNDTVLWKMPYNYLKTCFILHEGVRIILNIFIADYIVKYVELKLVLELANLKELSHKKERFPLKKVFQVAQSNKIFFSLLIIS